MATYKAIHILKDFSLSELEGLASLFSSEKSIIGKEDNPFKCIAYNPDCYLKNMDKISRQFENGNFRPVIITNYKFLALLLWGYKLEEFIFTDFSFKEDGEEAELEKEIVKGMLSDSDEVLNISNFLEENSQKIQYVELYLKSFQNRVCIHSNGNISLSNTFDKGLYSFIIKIVQFLFIGYTC